MLALCVLEKLSEEGAGGNRSGRFGNSGGENGAERRNDCLPSVEVISEGGEGLGSGERPDGTVPFAFACAMRTEERMMTLGCG